MLKNVHKRMISIMFFGFVFAVLAAPAMAQDVQAPSIGVVDIQAIVQKSTAGIHIQSQLDKKRKQYQKQIASKEDSLRDAEKKILSQKETLSAEDFTKKRREFEKDVIAAQKMVQKNKISLDSGVARGLSTLRDEIRVTIGDIAKTRGYGMVISKDSVIIAAKGMDITSDVLKALDKKIKKVPLDWKVK